MTEVFRPMDGPEMPQAPPVPAGCSRLPTHPDLDLSVTLTPERLSTETGILKQGKRGGRRAQRQVRFDVSPKSKETSGKPSGTPAEAHVVCTAVTQPSSQQAVTRTTCKSKKHKPLKGRKSGKKLGGPEPLVKEGVSVGGLAEEVSGTLHQRAELNTTLALKAELEDLTEKEFDPRRAVQQHLKASAYTKININVRATGGVNIPRSQNVYRELVSISVPEDQLISQALHDRLKLVRPTLSHGSKCQDSPAEGPDLLAFYNPRELFRETPLFPGDELKLPRPCPVPCPARTTFDLYRKHKQWES